MDNVQAYKEGPASRSPDDIGPTHESDCWSCKLADGTPGVASPAGGGDPIDADITGCLLPLLVEGYSLCEPLAIIVENLIIQQAATQSGCPWHEPRDPVVSG